MTRAGAWSRSRRRAGWPWRALLLGLGALAAPALGQEQAPLPEPDITYFGTVPAGSQLSLQHAAGLLDSTAAEATAPYVLTVQVVQAVESPGPALPPAGSAYVGDTATVLVDGVVQGRVTLAERGAIFRLDIPSPAKTPSPNAILSPVLVEPTVPKSCGDVACTPTPPRLGTPTPTRTGITGTGTPAASDTPTPTPTPTATPAGASCAGDCDNNGSVTISELVRGVNIALGNTAVEQCPAMDRNGNGAVAINELVGAVGNALNGCPEDAS